MESDNSIKKLISVLKPLIYDLDDLKKELESEKDELESVSRFLAYTKDKMEMVGIYADQDLIISNLEKINCSKDDYKASCYLLESNDENVQKLPQYKMAYDLVNRIIDYFKIYKADLIVGIQELNDKCQRKTVEKKYHDILTSSNPYVEDINEFRELLDTHDIGIEDKINILVDTIKNNILNYESGNK